MLKIRNHHKPMIDPKIGYSIITYNIHKPPSLAREYQCRKSQNNPQIRQENSIVFFLLEEGRAGIEVVDGPFRMGGVLLPGDVQGDVHDPAEELLEG
jgi:hypothetical protein